MKYMLMLYADEAAAAGITRSDMSRFLDQMRAFTANLVSEGAFISTGALEPSSSAATVRVYDGSVGIADGPIAERPEQLGGFFIIDAANDTAAREWAAKCPAATWGAIEVRALRSHPHQH